MRARALDSVRGLLPAATTSNVGIFGTGQAYEALLLRMRAHPLREAREYAELMLAELRKVIPAFLTRLDRPERGAAWSRYLAETREATSAVSRRLLAGIEAESRAEVTLTDSDPDGEVKVVAAALYAVSDLPDDQLLAIARKLSDEERAQVLAAYVGPAREPPAQAGTGLRAHGVPLRRARRLRRVPRPPAPPPADARVAAAVAPPRIRGRRRHRRRRRGDRTGPR